nr:MAG TPA: hypothetical protein [Caudoviricetes sp.]
MQIKDLAVGDGFVYLNEGSSKVKFYVLAHNYESGLNGKGRTLFCRESPANLTLDKFTAAVQKWISTTSYKYQYTNSVFGTLTKVQTGSANFFSLSVKELNVASDYYINQLADGSALSAAARTRVGYIRTASDTPFWTRSPNPTSSGYHKEDGENEYDYDYYYAVSSASGSSISVYKVDRSKTRLTTLPCFTLPETLYIDKDGFPTVNQPPEVTSGAGESGMALGEKSEPFTLSYTVTDGDGDPMRIVEKVNGVELAVHENVATGTELTVSCLSEKALFQQILNGESTLTLEVDDGKTTTEWTATFTKNVTSAQVSLTAPLTADDTITVASMTLEGILPEDMGLSVEMTNNGLDDSPVWENCTDIQRGESRAFVHHVFTNKTAARGFAFNYKITAARGASGVGGTITMIGGVIG